MLQGDPLGMFAYVIGVLPLIKRLKAAYPDITQPWYADNSSALGTLNNIGLYSNSFKQFGSGCGYYLEPSKIILIIHPDNLSSWK